MKNTTQKLTLLIALLFFAKFGMAQITTVGIIGSATANGWGMSTPMTRASATSSDWTITIPLTADEVKFRANDAWIINWGDPAFPAGMGTQDGMNIRIPAAATYSVTFNDATGAYVFARPSATKSASNAFDLSLFPNPASNMVKVAYNLPTAATATISVRNLLGQTVRSFPAVRQNAGVQAQELSLQGLAKGMYLVQCQNGTAAQTSRLVVE